MIPQSCSLMSHVHLHAFTHTCITDTHTYKHTHIHHSICIWNKILSVYQQSSQQILLIILEFLTYECVRKFLWQKLKYIYFSQLQRLFKYKTFIQFLSLSLCKTFIQVYFIIIFLKLNLIYIISLSPTAPMYTILNLSQINGLILIVVTYIFIYVFLKTQIQLAQSVCSL